MSGTDGANTLDKLFLKFVKEWFYMGRNYDNLQIKNNDDN